MSPCGSVHTSDSDLIDSVLEENAKDKALRDQADHSDLVSPEGPGPLQHHIQELISSLDLLSKIEAIHCFKRFSLARQLKIDHIFTDHQLMPKVLTGIENSFVVRSLHSQSLNSGPQHGMELQHGNIEIERVCQETRNDSGYGSGGSCATHFLYDSGDLEKLQRNQYHLTHCCFYYSDLDSHNARKYLCDKPTGTFLIRPSLDPRYLYSLSVMTERGATSVRILYNNGLFQFDSDERIRDKLPQFDSVLSLVDFHVMVTRDGSNRSWRWEETSGRKNMKVTLSKPLKNSLPTLSHLARVKINECLENVHMPNVSVDRLPISDKCKHYLKLYPYRV